jgi:hypothetical protein
MMIHCETPEGWYACDSAELSLLQYFVRHREIREAPFFHVLDPGRSMNPVGDTIPMAAFKDLMRWAEEFRVPKPAPVLRIKDLRV